MGHERFLTDFSIKMKLRFDNLLRNIDRFISSLLFILISTTGKMYFSKYLKKSYFDSDG